MILIQIAGHLGSDPETRFTPSGQKVTTIRVATNIKKAGKEKTVWWRVTIWGDRFDRKLQYLKKGSAVFILGDMSAPEIYQDKEGNPQISLELTAEYIGFNPFGKSDKPGAEGAQEGANNAESFQPSNKSAPSGFQPQQNQYQQSNQFQPKAAASQGIMPGAQPQIADFTDDEIPF
jgi:single-strand DNA-binding protein